MNRKLAVRRGSSAHSCDRPTMTRRRDRCAALAALCSLLPACLMPPGALTAGDSSEENGPVRAIGSRGVATRNFAVPTFWLFYKFTPIADTNGLFFQNLSLFPVINNESRVGFGGQLTGGVAGVFTRLGTGGINTLADTGQGEFRFFGITQSMNASGTVLFFSQFSGEPGEEVMLRGIGNSSTPLIDSGGAFRGFNGFELSDNGTAVLRAERNNGNDVILLKGTGSTSVVAEVGSLFSSLGRAPSINGDGSVAFTATRSEGIRGIYVRHGNSGPFFSVLDDTGPFIGFSGLDMNDEGAIVFSGTRATGNRGVYLVRDGSTTTIAEGAVGSQEFGGFTLNNSGRVAYQRGSSFGRSTFLGPNVARARVVGPGDVLFGRTVTATLIDRGALNDLGQLAVHLVFADGSSMIARVDPVIPPFFDRVIARSALQLSTGRGSGAGASTDVPNPGSPAVLTFDVNFLNDRGSLEVRVGDRVVHVVRPDEVGVEKRIRVLIDFSQSPEPPQQAEQYEKRGKTVGDAVSLAFRLRGKPGFAVQLDDVSIPGLVSSPMLPDEQSLAGWITEGVAAIVDTTRFPVEIDIQPGRDRNVVKRGERLEVAILSSAVLDAPAEIDRSSIRLGNAPVSTRSTGKGSQPEICRDRDINGDGLADVVCEIDSTRLAVADGPTELTLEAVTTSALAVRGIDSVNDGAYGTPGATRE